MDGSDIADATKKYWPYALGAVIGVYLLYRFAGSNSSGATVDSPVYLSAGGMSSESAAAYSLQQMQLANEARAIDAAAFNDFISAQGTAALGVGKAAADVIGALQTPTVAAINASAAENVATVQSAALLAAQSFASRAQMVGAGAIMAGLQSEQISAAVRSTGASVNASSQSQAAQFGSFSAAHQAVSQGNSSSSSSIWGAIGTAAAAYFSGGTIWV